MSYKTISVKEAVLNINADNNCWVLPAIQRPYVWGSRYENELYICKLFDSILRGYPIGGLILWNNQSKAPYRKFIDDYIQGESAKIVDDGVWSRKDKWLVYDGQQRLQTLFSCLKHTFNNKILAFDLLFKKSKDSDSEETGFSFIEKNSSNPLPWHIIKMNEIFIKDSKDFIPFKNNILENSGNITQEEKNYVEQNLNDIWKKFVETDKNVLSYFPVSELNENEVNEIFERLNTGGIALSLSDLLFSSIKLKFPFFEENLQTVSKKIYNNTNKGYIFDAYHILQLLNLIVKGAVRVDPKKVKDNQINQFQDIWIKLEEPLTDFFVDFIWGMFKINNSSVIPRRLALLPLIYYFYEIYNKGFSFKNISADNLKLIKKYFIKSQINDWSLQRYIDNFTKIIKEESSNSINSLFDFPLKKIEDKINEQKERKIEINEETFTGYTWFALKILTPNRIYQFDPEMTGRFNPEIDHIFPIHLNGMDEEYRKKVDILWNLQPTKGEINGYKLNYHPKKFFLDEIVNSKGEKIIGSKYINDFDFLFPVSNDKINFMDNIWDNVDSFIKKRRELMIKFFNDYYSIDIIEKT